MANNPWLASAAIIGASVAVTGLIWLLINGLMLWLGWIGGPIAFGIVMLVAFVFMGLVMKADRG